MERDRRRRKVFPGTRLIVQPGNPDDRRGRKSPGKSGCSKRRRNQDACDRRPRSRRGQDMSILEKLKAREAESDRMNFRKNPSRRRRSRQVSRD